jgi:hypothetical protein
MVAQWVVLMEQHSVVNSADPRGRRRAAGKVQKKAALWDVRWAVRWVAVLAAA